MTARGFDTTDLAVDVRGAVAVVKIDCGTPVNVVRPQTFAALCSTLDALQADSAVRAVVLGHKGRHFSGGADFRFLEALKGASEDEVRDHIYRHFQGGVRRLYEFPKPVVAAIGGAAITVGCEAALACDFRIVTEDAVFQESWIRLGLIPPLGGLKMLAATVGRGLACDMILRGRPVGGAEAVRAGLAHELVTADELDARSFALAEELAAAAPLAYVTAKAGMREAMDASLEETFAAGLREQCRMIASRDFAEGVDALVARRRPVFEGR